MIRFIVLGAASGILFGLMDALIHANPLAQRLYEYTSPIARTSVNPTAGILIDLSYGFVMAGIFLILYDSLPGNSGVQKGLSYAIIMWFFRVVMSAASEWMTVEVPAVTLGYMLLTGLIEMLVLGVLYGLTLRPASAG